MSFRSDHFQMQRKKNHFYSSVPLTQLGVFFYSQNISIGSVKSFLWAKIKWKRNKIAEDHNIICGIRQLTKPIQMNFIQSFPFKKRVEYFFLSREPGYIYTHIQRISFIYRFSRFLWVVQHCFCCCCCCC